MMIWEIGVFCRAFLTVHQVNIVVIFLNFRYCSFVTAAVPLRPLDIVHKFSHHLSIVAETFLVGVTVGTLNFVARTLLDLLERAAGRAASADKHVVRHVLFFAHVDQIAHVAPVKRLRLHEVRLRVLLYGLILHVL